MNVSSVASHTTISRKELLFVTLLLAGALLLRILHLDSYPVMSSDGTGYALSGKRFIHSLNLNDVGVCMPPLYHFFIGLFSLMSDNLETATRLVSVCFSTLTLIPLYFLARSYFGTMVAAGTVILYVLLPFSHYMSGIDLSEPTYTFFAVSGLYMAVQGMTDKTRFKLLLAGVLLGLAYLARPEGIVLFAGLWLVFLLGILLKREDRTIAGFTTFLCLSVGFLVVALPYMTALHNMTGKWQISGKLGINTKFIMERNGLKGAYESQFRINSDGNGYVGGGVETPVTLLKERPDIFWNNIKNNLLEFPGKVSGNVPYYLLIFAIIGMLCTPVSKVFTGRLALFATFFPLISYIVFAFDPRYFYPYMPIVLLFTSAGLNHIGVLASRLLQIRLPVGLSLIVLVSGYYLYLDIPRLPPPYHYTQDGGRFDDKQVGLRLKTLLPPEAVLLTRSSRVGFYANRQILIPPDEDLRTSLDFARKNGVTHIVANMQLHSMRPAFEPLYQPLILPGSLVTVPDVELIYIGQESGGQPYLVYRLK